MMQAASLPPLAAPRLCWLRHLLNRYLTSKCCTDAGHITNFESGTDFSEMTNADKIVEDLAHEASFSEQVKVFHLTDLWHGSDRHLTELQTE